MIPRGRDHVPVQPLVVKQIRAKTDQLHQQPRKRRAAQPDQDRQCGNRHDADCCRKIRQLLAVLLLVLLRLDRLRQSLHLYSSADSPLWARSSSKAAASAGPCFLSSSQCESDSLLNRSSPISVISTSTSRRSSAL